MPDASALAAHLTESRSAKIARIDGHSGRAFGAPVAFERPDPEMIIECLRNAFGKLLGSRDNILQTPEIFWRTTPDISLQKRRRRHQERGAVPAHETANDIGIKRIGMINHSNSRTDGSIKVAVNPNEWKNGRIPSNRSPLPSANI